MEEGRWRVYLLNGFFVSSGGEYEGRVVVVVARGVHVFYCVFGGNGWVIGVKGVGEGRRTFGVVSCVFMYISYTDRWREREMLYGVVLLPCLVHCGMWVYIGGMVERVLIGL